ncbi:succinylglutamate desuccinylase/aspartoacylase family protein [Variovorax dokdonensis]|uniref:Succinylglutamate desuccinylase/aspartoacylase family protein n=1 Tax=Variovorax dokdonensis TaxID=344883 RepID=A0ABT7NF50_9BURK|nr:succinylglutamate desuccinylase/aspartoacylase family protein [Variovorax dokdonensis]MDM0046495.1 succinylglutamate desuccinylase/aspartoacylase family protein [Variovorax dokdonensis]
MSEPFPSLEILPRDLSAYAQGNIGVPYVHRFESGLAGPHVLINALTHGNEICGMVAATHLLDTQVRPKIGTLTISFAHVEAYNAFNADKPFANRQIEHNLNRVWSDDLLGGSENSPELRRARELRPVVAAADHILDIHSTSQDNEPFWVYPGFERNARVAQAIGLPSTHLVMPSGLGSGTPLIQHGAHGGEHAPGAALVAECGQHFRRSSAEVATEVTLRFLAHFGLIDHTPSAPVGPQRRFELLRTCMVTTPEFRFTRPLVGFETFAQGDVIATDGEQRIVAPCDHCTVFMPTREPIVGREAVYLTRPL